MDKTIDLRVLWLSLGLLAFVGGACGGSSNDSAAASTNGTESAAAIDATPDVPEDASTPSSSGSAEPSSLEEYLGTAANFLRNSAGQGGGQRVGAGFDQDEQLEQQRLVQQEIQICMQQQGFEYAPEEVGDGLRFFLGSLSTTLSAQEYAETEGFGISTRFDAILEGDVDLTESTSPNDEHLATLSEGAADAWQLALRGEPPVRNDQGQLVDPETGEPVQGRGATGGCTLDAQTAVRGDISALADLTDEFAELEERIGADPRVAEIAREWSACMTTEGFDYQDESEARAEINTMFRPLLRTFFQGAGGQQAAGPGAGAAGGGGNRLQAIAGLELTPEQDADLNALQDLERAIAVASVQCQGDTDVELEAIRTRYESEFVAANRDALEAFAS